MSEEAPEAYLQALAGCPPAKIALSAGLVCRIGRGENNSLVLDDFQISRNHAMVQCTPAGEYYLTDLGSRNGTFVNGRRVTAPVILQPEDRIAIGKFELLFSGPASRQRAPSRGETVGYFFQQVISVLVVDIRDFTGLSSRLGETRISELISFFTRESGRALSDSGAWSQKFIGDAAMGVWLHPGKAPGLSEFRGLFRALSRIFEIVAGMEAQFALDRPVKIGAGVNTGLAAMGNMGSDAGADYTALSDAVNLAFRLESATKEVGCDLALGHRTYEAVMALADVSDLFTSHKVELKGYKEPKPLYAAQLPGLHRLVAKLLEQEPACGVDATVTRRIPI